MRRAQNLAASSLTGRGFLLSWQWQEMAKGKFGRRGGAVLPNQIYE
jgi:hypothetical protein